MSLADLTPEAVRQAIAEFDRLGRDAFLSTYGFGKARGYFLVHIGSPIRPCRLAIGPREARLRINVAKFAVEWRQGRRDYGPRSLRAEAAHQIAHRRTLGFPCPVFRQH
jgi:hypothetical protein